MHLATLTHANGDVTEIHHDDEPQDQPWLEDEWLSTLVQCNTRNIDFHDEPEFHEARDRWRNGFVREKYSNDAFPYRYANGSKEQMLERWARIHKGAVAFTYWSSHSGDDSFGYAWITQEALDDAGLDHAADPEDVLRCEIRTLQAWCSGEVYGVVYKPNRWAAANILDPHAGDEQACWGYYGYDSYADLAKEFTDSPIIDEEAHA